MIAFKTKHSDTIHFTFFGFLKFRKELAKKIDNEFGKLYERYVLDYSEDTESAIKECIKTLDDVKYSIADFCLQSDCDGKISYITAKNILSFIKDMDDDYNYGRFRKETYISDIVNVLEQSAKHRCNVIWY